MTDPDYGTQFAAAELDAYRRGMDQLAWDKPRPGWPLVETRDHNDEPIFHMQHTYSGLLAWCCGTCLRISLGANPAGCHGCADPDNLSPYTFGPVTCRTVTPYDGPCLLADSDGCHCHEVRP